MSSIDSSLHYQWIQGGRGSGSRTQSLERPAQVAHHATKFTTDMNRDLHLTSNPGLPLYQPEQSWWPNSRGEGKADLSNFALTKCCHIILQTVNEITFMESHATNWVYNKSFLTLLVIIPYLPSCNCPYQTKSCTWCKVINDLPL